MTSFAIIGLGKTGYAAAKFLTRMKKPFILMDSKLPPSALANFNAEFPEAPCYLGELDFDLLRKVDKVIMSPGVCPLACIRQLGHEKIFSDIDLFAEYAKAPIIGITGTNAKGTVTTLLGNMLKEAGYTVAVGGNIGFPALDLLAAPAPDFYVLELSSFQLEVSHDIPFIASTILNITPDHLDRHGNFERYIAAKQKIYLNTKNAIYYREDKNTYPQHSVGKKVNFGLSVTSDVNAIDASIISTLHIKGKHNILNGLAALAIGHAIDLPLEAMLCALKNFSGLAHRCESLGEKNHLYWINDSKGTNVGATLAALEGFGAELNPGQKIILILGGLSKNQDFTPLQHAVTKYTREIILIGQDAPLIQHALNKGVFAHSLSEAVNLALQTAHHNDIVLLSPACASFDMFKDFEDRGNQFKLLVKSL